MRIEKLLIVILTVLIVASGAFAQKFKVGIYQNPPLVAMDEQGNPYGFFIDVLEHIAREEGWQLDYRTYNFNSGLEALKRGEIDILPDLGHSTEREEMVNFSNTTLLTTWAEVYIRDGETGNFKNIMDLNGVSIAALKSDFFLNNQHTGLLALTDELGIEAEVVELSSYEQVLQKLADGEVEAALVSKLYGDFNAARFAVSKTPIMLAHISLRFGFAKDSVLAATVIPVFDKHISAVLKDRSSVYYQSQEKYLTAASDSLIPGWLWRVLLILGIGIAVLGSINILLQAQVKKKTEQLERTNRELVHSERQARLAAVTIEASKDIGFWFKPGEPFNRVNQAAIDLLGYSRDELMRMAPVALLASEEDKKMIGNLRSNGWDGHLRMEAKFKSKQGTLIPVEISLDRIQFEGEEYICGFARDISKRRKSEAALKKSEERLQLALEAANEGLWDLDFKTGLISFDDRFVASLGYRQSELAPVRETWRNLMHPDDLAKVDDQVKFFLKNEKGFIGVEFRLKNNDGEYVWFLFHGKITQVDEAGKPMFATGTIVNINDLKSSLQENEKLLLDLRERNKELRCLYKVSQLVADTSNSVNDVLRGTISVVPESFHYPDITCVRIRSERGEFVSDNFKSTPWSLTAPIVTADGVSGEIAVHYLREMPDQDIGPFFKEERDLVDTLGKQLGNMIDAKNAEYKVVASILETEDRERKRISKEIHDSLGQTLSAISLNMDMVSKQVDRLDAKAQEKFGKSLELVHLAVSESRSISHNLMPVTLDDFGFVVAVENMLESIGDAASIQFGFYSNLKGKRLSKNVELSLFRITQEAVNNIIKHAGAKAVTIQLMSYDDVAILTIEDNGKGFDVENVDESSKFGLSSMRNRATSVHGTLTLDSRTDKGTIITVHVPLNNLEDEDTIGG
jgi:PAS domain S-box-containing protein